MKGGTNGQTDERTNEQTDEQKSPCVLQDFVPLGAAAQKARFGPERHRGGAYIGMDRQTENKSFHDFEHHSIFLKITSTLKDGCSLTNRANHLNLNSL